jgi:hypothetical protein
VCAGPNKVFVWCEPHEIRAFHQRLNNKAADSADDKTDKVIDEEGDDDVALSDPVIRNAFGSGNEERAGEQVVEEVVGREFVD